VFDNDGRTFVGTKLYSAFEVGFEHLPEILLK